MTSMTCHACGAREATVHVMEVAGAAAATRELCPECAADVSIIPGLSIEQAARRAEDRRCKRCGGYSSHVPGLALFRVRTTAGWRCPQCECDDAAAGDPS